MAIKVQGITVIDDGRNIINGIGASFSGIITANTFDGNFSGDGSNITGLATNLSELTNDVGFVTFTNNNQLTNGAGYITTSFTNTNQLTNGAGYITTSFTNTNQLTNGAGFVTFTNNNQLTNGAGFITTSFTNTNQLTNGAGFVTFTNNNQLTNGAGYITTSFTNTNQLTNGAGFITTSFTNTNELTNGAGFVTFTNNNQLTNGAGYITTSFTNTNQLTNGAGFITNNVTGIITATTFDGNFSGNVTGIASTATKLETSRNFSISGDVVASSVSFDGTGNVSLAATIQPNSVALATDTTGDFVQSITGTANEVTVSATSGENSTPQIGLPNDVTIGQDLTVTRNIDVDGHTELDDVNVSGALTATSLNVTDKLITTGIGISIANGAGNTAYIEGPSEIWIDPHPFGVGQTSGSVRIRGDLYVDGTEFIVDVDKIQLGDFRIGIATTAGTNALLDGGGLGIGSESIEKTITWNNATSALMSSENWNLASGKHYEIAGTDVLTSNTLGSGIINSSLTSVGTLGALTVSGIVTATTFSGSGASLTDIPNGALTNSSVSFGGVSTSLGNNVAQPAFDLTNATSYPYTSLTGITTEIVGDTSPELGGNLILNNNDITGTGGINVTGVVTATSFVGSSAVVGSGVTINSNGLNITGVVTATSFSGSGSALTELTGASAATYGDASNVAQIVVDANGRITEISDVTISGGDTVSITTTAADILSVSSGAISADDAGADKIVFWDNSEGKLTYLTVGTNLTVTDTTISASGGGGSGPDPVIMGMIF